jgi:hypothetical protein
MNLSENFEFCVVQATRAIKEESAKKVSARPWASNRKSGERGGTAI